MTDGRRHALLEDLVYLHRELNRVPSLFDIDQYLDHSPEDYLDSFSTLDHALLEAGILDRYPAVQTMDMIADLHRVMEKVGRVPRQTDYSEHGNHTRATITNRFGSWPDAQVAAGLESTSHKEHSDEYLERSVKRLAIQVEGRPTLRQVDLLSDLDPNELTRRYGPWNEYLDEIGIGELGR